MTTQRFHNLICLFVKRKPKKKKKKRRKKQLGTCDRRPFKMGVFKIENSVTASNFVAHLFDFHILLMLLGATCMANLEVPTTVV